jgi:DNA-binding transcriptional LysR family regulator
MNIRMRLYAGQAYIDERGYAATLDDLRDHRLICQQAGAAQVQAGAALVQMLNAHAPASTLAVNNYFGVLQGVLNNLGIGVLPDYLTLDFPELVRVLPEVESVEVPVFLAYPEELRNSKRVSAFRDFVMDEVIAFRRTIRT